MLSQKKVLSQTTLCFNDDLIKTKSIVFARLMHYHRICRSVRESIGDKKSWNHKNIITCVAFYSSALLKMSRTFSVRPLKSSVHHQTDNAEGIYFADDECPLNVFLFLLNIQSWSVIDQCCVPKTGRLLYAIFPQRL